MKVSNEKELTPHALLVQVHCETSRPPKMRLGLAVRSAFDAGTRFCSSGAAFLRKASPCSLSS